MSDADQESLSDKCSQPPIMVFEGFVLRPFDGWNLWLENPHGEGTQIKKIAWLALLDRFFKDNF